jgi:transglutaminase-like putative cysteine protease
MQGDHQVGFASSSIDTMQQSINVTEYLVADLPVGGKNRRATARTFVSLSRALRVKSFEISVNTESAPLHAGGRVEGDSVLVFALTTGSEKPDSQRIALSGPVLLPTLVPLAVVLTDQPKVGKRYVMPVLNPTSMNAKDIALNVRAETTFVVNDSAVFDTTTRVWHGIQPARLRAWRIEASENVPGVLSAWVDDQGRIVETTQLGFVLKRLPYEVAWENWKNQSTAISVSENRDILETTAIAAKKRLGGNIDALQVRLSGVDLAGFDIGGKLSGDTLTIRRAADSTLDTSQWKLAGYARRDRENKFVNIWPEPLIQSSNSQIRDLAKRLRGNDTDARVVAQRINKWVHDSIADRITVGVPSALEVLKNRVGDCNEHTQLFVALARAAGIPARIAAGLAYLDGKFYYHAWPEVLLKDWVAVDPTFGQFPADAAHLRFTLGGLGRQTELLRLMGNLQIDVLATNRGVK